MQHYLIAATSTLTTATINGNNTKRRAKTMAFGSAFCPFPFL